MKKITLYFFALCLTIFTSCDNKNKHDVDNIQKVTLIEEWFPSACFSGDMFAIYETSEEYNIEIDVKPGADDIDPVKLVLADVANFGVAGGDRILTANQMGADLVVIAVINYKSPTVFIALEEKQIKTPKDFEGKNVGIMTGNNTEYVYNALIERTRVDKSKINEIEAPYDLATFITKAYDVRPAFAYDETVSLDIQNIQYTTIKPEEYEVNFVGPVIFAKKSFVENNKELTQKFINAMCKGWQNAINMPEKAIEYLKKYDNTIETERELKSLIKGKEYFAGEDGKPLYLSEKRWEMFVQELVDLKIIPPSEIHLSSFDNSFLINYYNIKQ